MNPHASRKPLVQFNATYYRYPTSLSRGYWARYITDLGLTSQQSADRSRWLSFADHLSRSSFGRFVSQSLMEPSDPALLQSLIQLHGPFAERFFLRETRERVMRRIFASEIDLARLANDLSRAWDTDFLCISRQDAAFRCLEHLFDQALLRRLGDQDTRSAFLTWYDRYASFQRCELCGQRFRTIDLPDWIYFGSNGQKQCCFQCPIVDAPTKTRLRDLIPRFVASCGFVPTSDASPICYSFTSRIPESAWLHTIAAFAKMGGIDHAKSKYGSWFLALAATRALPQGVLVSARGVRCVSLDGHACHSIDEQRIDNWLHAHGIAHEREPSYPPHPTFNPKGRRRADWQVKGTYVEYFGLVGEPTYDLKVDEKIALASALGIRMVMLYPSDLEDLDHALAELQSLT